MEYTIKKFEEEEKAKFREVLAAEDKAKQVAADAS
jgi:hypothetical protein